MLNSNLEVTDLLEVDFTECTWLFYWFPSFCFVLNFLNGSNPYFIGYKTPQPRISKSNCDNVTLCNVNVSGRKSQFISQRIWTFYNLRNLIYNFRREFHINFKYFSKNPNDWNIRTLRCYESRKRNSLFSNFMEFVILVNAFSLFTEKVFIGFKCQLFIIPDSQSTECYKSLRLDIYGFYQSHYP